MFVIFFSSSKYNNCQRNRNISMCFLFWKFRLLYIHAVVKVFTPFALVYYRTLYIIHMIADRIWLIHSHTKSHHVSSLLFFAIPLIVHFSFSVAVPIFFVLWCHCSLCYATMTSTMTTTTTAHFFSLVDPFLFSFALDICPDMLWSFKTLGATMCRDRDDLWKIWNWLIRCDNVFLFLNWVKNRRARLSVFWWV